MPQFKKEFGTNNQIPVMDWFESFWVKKSRELDIDTYKRMNGEQLYLANLALQNDMEKFWKFRCQNVIRMVNLHMKRRARLLLAFSFQQYKYQVQKSKVQLILDIKEGIYRPSQNNISDSHTFMQMRNQNELEFDDSEKFIIENNQIPNTRNRNVNNSSEYNSGKNKNRSSSSQS